MVDPLDAEWNWMWTEIWLESLGMLRLDFSDFLAWASICPINIESYSCAKVVIFLSCNGMLRNAWRAETERSTSAQQKLFAVVFVGCVLVPSCFTLLGRWEARVCEKAYLVCASNDSYVGQEDCRQNASPIPSKGENLLDRAAVLSVGKGGLVGRGV